jgi:hypothetical protein
MAGEYVVWKSELIDNADEARNYYAQRLQRAWHITCHAKPVTIVFQPRDTHTFSESITEDNTHMPKVSRRFSSTNTEERAFSPERARLMDRIIPSIERFSRSIHSVNVGGRQLFGPPMPGGMRLSVVLRRGLGETWNVVTAFPVDGKVWMQAVRAKAAKFPC